MLCFFLSSGVGFQKGFKQVGHTAGQWELVRFKDSEIKPAIKTDPRGKDVVIVGSTSNPVNDRYMELFLLADALRRSACSRITCVMPYMGYSRQNQQHLPGEPVSAQLMVRFIESVGIDEVVTVDLHEEQLAGMFTIPVTHMSALPLLAERIGADLAAQNPNGQVVVVSPDQGGVERTRVFRDALGSYIRSKGVFITIDDEIGMVEKKRNLEGIHDSKAVEISGDVTGKTVIIPDDVVVSGSTIVNAAKMAMENGARSVILAATHADFIEGTMDRLMGVPGVKVWLTDSIPLQHTDNSTIKLISLQELLIKAISPN